MYMWLASIKLEIWLEYIMRPAELLVNEMKTVGKILLSIKCSNAYAVKDEHKFELD